jgi:hypothetical protein
LANLAGDETPKGNKDKPGRNKHQHDNWTPQIVQIQRVLKPRKKKLRIKTNKKKKRNSYCILPPPRKESMWECTEQNWGK